LPFGLETLALSRRRCYQLKRDIERNRGGERDVSPEKGGLLRLACHVIITSAGWVFFGYFWFVVIRRGWYGKGIPLALMAMAAFTVLLLVLTSFWIRHNIRIAKEERRRSAPDIECGGFIDDKTGLELVVDDIDSLKQSPVIDIEIIDGRKLVTTGSVAGGTNGGERSAVSGRKG